MRILRAVIAAGALVAAAAGGASAADGSIAHVEPTSDGVRILVSVPPDADVDLGGVTVTINEQDAVAEAVPANSSTLVQRTAVLAIDTSNSMKGERFEAAKAAALAYLDAVPDDVRLGIVTFAAEVVASLEPTTNRASARAVIDGLELARETRLYDGVRAAAEMAGDDGQRSLLVLSDGADTSDTPIEDVTAAITEAGLLVDVVALDQSGPDLDLLGQLADAGNGRVISSDSTALAETFSAEADVLATQVLVTAELPEGETASQGTVEVILPSSAGDITASAYSTIGGDASGAPETAAPERSWTPSEWVMYAGVGAVGVGLVAFLMTLVPASSKQPVGVVDRVASYASGASGEPAHKSEGEAPLTHAKEAAAGVLKRNKSLEEKITHRLEGAGSELKSSEWLLLHIAIFAGAGLVGVLIGQGNAALGAVFMVVGLVAPWIYLGIRRSRRRKAFNAALPDTLQLISGSLSAGLSLAQSVDTIVREGSEPVSSEFRRVLVETRLGVPIEAALESVAERFESKDFAWVVMAINIQRQVGGNLAELLDSVAATMREREYLRRQVGALSAEGRISAWVLSVLPPGFLLYLLVAQRDYVMPLFTDIRGLVMLIGATLWLSVGVFWMSKLVKVEV